jgi:hypothetical protein
MFLGDTWRILPGYVRVRDDSLDNFVVNEGVDDSLTVLLIQLEEETVEQGILVLNT